MTTSVSDPKDRAPILWLLLGLFCFRVLAQLVQAGIQLPFLPAFEDWHSGVLPYGALLSAQIVIVAAMFLTAREFQRGRVVPRRRLGRVLLVLGGRWCQNFCV